MSNLNQKSDTRVFDNKNKPQGALRLMLAFKNSLRAVTWLLKNEAAFKQECILLIIATVVLIFWPIAAVEKAVLFSAILFVIFAEIVNTAIEVTIDRMSKEIHPLSGLAKDLGSAGVLVSMLIAIVLWSAVFIDYMQWAS